MAEPGRRPFPGASCLSHAVDNRCNVFQGRFPDHNSAADGYAATCPVNAYAPNGYGLHNVCGNVWEWTADFFSPTWHAADRPADAEGSPGPHRGRKPRWTKPGQKRRVQKGGSFLCHHSYCNRYRLGARTANAPDSSTTNAGFPLRAGGLSGRRAIVCNGWDGWGDR